MTFLDKMKSQIMSTVHASSEAVATEAEAEATEAATPAAAVDEVLALNEAVESHVTCDVLNVRSTPSTANPRIGTLKRGESLKVLGLSDEWLQIDYQGQKAYVCAMYTDYSAPKMVVTATSLNIRKGPSTDDDKIGSLAQGTEVRALSEKNGWVKILHKSGYGYVSKSYLK